MDEARNALGDAHREPAPPGLEALATALLEHPEAEEAVAPPVGGGSRPPAPPPPRGPGDWEEVPVFRETYLAYLTRPGDAEALRRLGRLLYEMTLEYCVHFPAPEDSAVQVEARAALADLRHLAGFLAHLGRQHRESALAGEGDVRLSRQAQDLAHHLREVGLALEASLGGAP